MITNFTDIAPALQRLSLPPPFQVKVYYDSRLVKGEPGTGEYENRPVGVSLYWRSGLEIIETCFGTYGGEPNYACVKERPGINPSSYLGSSGGVMRDEDFWERMVGVDPSFTFVLEGSHGLQAKLEDAIQILSNHWVNSQQRLTSI